MTDAVVAPEVMAENAERAAAMLRLLGHAGRLMIVCHLLGGEQTVGALEGKLGLSQSALSQHLAKLRAGGVVRVRRDGTHMRYSLASEDAAQLVALLHRRYCEA